MNKDLVKSMRRGRPPAYNTVEEFADKISEYFDTGCVKTKINKLGEEIEVSIPTITGLSVYMGFAGRDSLYKQAQRSEEFLYTLKVAQTMIATEFEENLQMGEATTGSIFWLKCMEGWIEEEKKQANQTVEKKHKFAITVG
ncbi:MAG: hypothetical protein GY799_00470 [Desulfobulbaceae bacterium]|nr:hypothetical protein [Desulfobulbaceae bacterium]